MFPSYERLVTSQERIKAPKTFNRSDLKSNEQRDFYERSESLQTVFEGAERSTASQYPRQLQVDHANNDIELHALR